MILNEREVKILEKFYYDDNVKISDLAEEYGVTSRMIRYNISKINQLLIFLKIAPIKNLGNGLYHFFSKSPKIIELIKELAPIDKEKRIKLINLVICYSNKKITVEYLAKFFNISRITVNSYLKEINSKLVKENIQIKNETGIILKGNIQNIVSYKILILSDMIQVLNNEFVNEYSSKVKEIIFQNISHELYIELRGFTYNFIENFKITINETNYNLFFSKILYACMYKHNYEKFDKKEIIRSKEYKYTVSKLKKLNLSENVLLNISYINLWLKAYNNYEKNYGSIINIELLSKKIINHVSLKLNIELANDEILNEFLIQHLKSLIHRLKEGYKIKYTYINDENKIYDDLYDYILQSINIFNEIFEVDIDENEIHLLRLHFLASIDRINNKELKPKNIIILTELGQGSKKILIENIKSKFLVDVKYIGSEFELPKNLKQIDDIHLILTTQSLLTGKYKSKKIVKINPILTLKDENKIKLFGIKSSSNKILISNLIENIKKYALIYDEKRLILDLLTNFKNNIIDNKNKTAIYNTIIKEENIILDYEAINIEHAVSKSLSILEKEYIDKSYTNEVLKILKKSPDFIIIYNGVIIPHTKNKNNVFKSGMSIIYLNKPIKMKNINEKIEVIVSFAIKDEKDLTDMIFTMITKVFNNDFKDLLIKKNKLKIIEYLNDKKKD
ncbi:BglG family transcription antiterminator [Oceanivirga salmonicida]|uniref:BglG family transcription antiterminator n=2 Tax=Oceanivirga salmonicida TaxID=1769291 RepID=UPI0012E147D6|nr:PRD domain-containing protein [Oceanivirga salmonicida]